MGSWRQNAAQKKLCQLGRNISSMRNAEAALCLSKSASALATRLAPISKLQIFRGKISRVTHGGPVEDHQLARLGRQQTLPTQALQRSVDMHGGKARRIGELLLRHRPCRTW